ncbi:MAG: OmpA family protein, partial [Paludibacter sp.]
MFSFLNVNAQDNTGRNSAEPFNLSVKFENIGWQDFFVLYNEPNDLYLPVSQLFDFVKINSKLSTDGKVLEGYFIDPKNPYKIDFDTRSITYKAKTTTLTDNDVIYDLGTMYLSPQVLESVFGFNTKFDFRTLSANISTNYELPICKLKKLDDARRNIKNITGDEKFDATYPRKYHLFKPGMLDWSISSNQSQVYGNETRAGLALGTEMFGGELSAWLYYSDKYGFNRNQQRYHWRWVDNNFKVMKQVQFGRIYNRNIATMLYPVDGFMVTNAPTTVRKALGTFQIAQNTNPDWTVELYINNVLMDYTKADASGYFAFQVPIVYGTTDVTLRFYGPNGEEQAERKSYNMPYNMLPKGEFEYRVSGGVLLDATNSLYARAETNMGLTKWLTAGAGYEFLNSIVGNPHIPFGNLTLQPFSRLILTGEYAHKVRYKGTLNYNFANNSMFEMYYARYDKNQKAIIYNFLEERMAGFSFPSRFKNVSSVTKATFRQNIYPNFQYNAGELMMSAYYRNFNANLSNFINWTTFDNRNIYSNLSLGFRFGGGFSFRPSVLYSYTENNPVWYNNFISYRAELEKQIFKKGYLSLGYEKNNLVNYQSVNVAFRYDFSFMSTYASAFYNVNDRTLQTTQSARGSLAFGSGNGYVHFDSREAVGRSGISIVPFVDKNFNGLRDVNEPATSDLNVRCNGGKVLQRKNDSIVRVVSLDPFVDYALTVSETDFKNIAWRVTAHTIKVTTDPNQFKTINIPVQPLGEMSGMVVDEFNNGISRILINIFNSKGKTEKTVMTESDGFYSYLGLKPGQYYAVVDSTQLKVLNMSAEPAAFKIKEDVNGDIVEAGTIKLVRNVIAQSSTEQSAEISQRQIDNKLAMSNLKSREDSLKLLYEQNKFTDKNTKDPDRIHKYDSLLRYIILFDFNSSTVRSEFYGTIKQLGKMLKENEELKLEIQGHTDSSGDQNVNLLFSERRANSVKRMLVKYGISEDRLRVVGFGEKVPAPGNTNKNRAQRTQNRRVVFKAISDKDMARVDSIGRKAPEDITASDLRTLKKSFNYVNESDP